MLKIGLTGGISSGKTSVSSEFSKLGVPIIDADLIARGLFKSASPLLDSLKNKFGPEIFLPDGSLDRKALGKIVFSSKESLDWLNQLTHPLVSAEMERQLAQLSAPYVILDIPLLINKEGKIPAHLKSIIDRVLVIDIDIETQIQRLCTRDNITSEEAMAVINNQSSLEQKLPLADDIIDNNNGLGALALQVKKLNDIYLNLSSSLPK